MQRRRKLRTPPPTGRDIRDFWLLAASRGLTPAQVVHFLMAHALPTEPGRWSGIHHRRAVALVRDWGRAFVHPQ